MSILKQTKRKHSKQISVLLVVLIMLSPIISSANTLLMSESTMLHHSVSVSTENGVEQMKSTSGRDSCHETSTQVIKDSTKVTSPSVTNDCCDESCLCAQAGCQSTTAVFHNLLLSVNPDNVAFNFTASIYLNPHTAPSFPPPIS